MATKCVFCGDLSTRERQMAGRSRYVPLCNDDQCYESALSADEFCQAQYIVFADYIVSGRTFGQIYDTCEWCEEPVCDTDPGDEYGKHGWWHDRCADHRRAVMYGKVHREDFHTDG